MDAAGDGSVLCGGDVGMLPCPPLLRSAFLVGSFLAVGQPQPAEPIPSTSAGRMGFWGPVPSHQALAPLRCWLGDLSWLRAAELGSCCELQGERWGASGCAFFTVLFLQLFF